jgi:hypothetical protein
MPPKRKPDPVVPAPEASIPVASGADAAPQEDKVKSQRSFIYFNIYIYFSNFIKYRKGVALKQRKTKTRATPPPYQV